MNTYDRGTSEQVWGRKKILMAFEYCFPSAECLMLHGTMFFRFRQIHPIAFLLVERPRCANRLWLKHPLALGTGRTSVTGFSGNLFLFFCSSIHFFRMSHGHSWLAVPNGTCTRTTPTHHHTRWWWMFTSCARVCIPAKELVQISETVRSGKCVAPKALAPCSKTMRLFSTQPGHTHTQ